MAPGGTVDGSGQVEPSSELSPPLDAAGLTNGHRHGTVGTQTDGNDRDCEQFCGECESAAARSCNDQAVLHEQTSYVAESGVYRTLFTEIDAPVTRRMPTRYKKSEVI